MKRVTEVISLYGGPLNLELIHREKIDLNVNTIGVVMNASGTIDGLMLLSKSNSRYVKYIVSRDTAKRMIQLGVISNTRVLGNGHFDFKYFGMSNVTKYGDMFNPNTLYNFDDSEKYVALEAVNDSNEFLVINTDTIYSIRIADVLDRQSYLGPKLALPAGLIIKTSKKQQYLSFAPCKW